LTKALPVVVGPAPCFQIREDSSEGDGNGESMRGFLDNNDDDDDDDADDADDAEGVESGENIISRHSYNSDRKTKIEFYPYPSF
jgi:hypothetical protein